MENNFTITLAQIEIAHLDLKYSHTRIDNSNAAVRMSESMERFGQISPVIVVPAKPLGFTLIDGYIRIAALKRCAKDTVKAQVWQCSEQDAMLQVFARTQDRKWEVFEQAILIQELKINFQLSHAKIAGYLGKAKSFVTRRLALLDSLDDKTCEHIRSGTISVWSAARVLVPLARANPEHAKLLTENLSEQALSTRQLATVFKHYKKSNKKVRKQIVSRPHLFLKVLKANQAEAQSQQIGQGPEGKWLKDIQIVKHMLYRLKNNTALVLYETQSQLDQRLLLTAFEETQAAFLSLTHEIRRCHDITRRQTNHIEATIQGNLDAKNTPLIGALKKDDTTGNRGGARQKTSEALTISAVDTISC
jgi:ParB/RepB/Spo0J family partition protein